MRAFLHRILVVFTILRGNFASQPINYPENTPNGSKETENAKKLARALLDKMTLEEKVVMLHGSPSPAYSGGGSYVGYVPGNSRLV